MAAKEARKAYAHLKREKRKQKELARRMQTKYNRIPEGILIYRLDTSKKRLMLMSPPHNDTNLSTLVVEMTVVSAYPSPNKSRRGIVMVGADGQEATLTACEQRTAVSWLEAINLMTAKAEHSQRGFSSLLKVRKMLAGFLQYCRCLRVDSHNLSRSSILVAKIQIKSMDQRKVTRKRIR